MTLYFLHCEDTFFPLPSKYIEEEGQRFIRDFMVSNKPAVLVDFQQKWTLIDSSNRRDSAAFQLATILKGNPTTVRVSVSESGRFDGPEPAEIWGLSNSVSDVLVR